MARDADWPACGFNPLRIARQSLANPAGISGRFVPAHAHHGLIALSSRELAVAPIARARVAATVDKIQHGRPDLTIPDRHVLVAARRDEVAILCVGHRTPV